MPAEVVITHALRTVMAKAGTALRGVSAVELGRQAIVELLERADLVPERVDEVIIGCAGNPFDAANVARVIALRARLPIGVPAVTVQRNCGSGLEAITSAVERIRGGRAEIVLAGGVESMSNYPLLFSHRAQRLFEALYTARGFMERLRVLSAFRPRHFRPVASLETGLTDPVCGLNMGETAEVLAQEFHVSREAQDQFALRSHQRATAAEESGQFAAERVAVRKPPSYEDVVEVDVGPRAQQNMQALARLKPVFDSRYGSVTAGNSCMVTDGAAMTLLMTEQCAYRLGYEPMARISGYAWAGLTLRRMGLGPCYATPAALEEANLDLDSIDLIELNEAFAAQVLACEICFRSTSFAREQLGRSKAIGELDHDRLNVNGGAIALGHPVGATGARLVVTLLHELLRRDLASGLVTLCIGGGQGGAMVLQR